MAGARDHQVCVRVRGIGENHTRSGAAHETSTATLRQERVATPVCQAGSGARHE